MAAQRGRGKGRSRGAREEPGLDFWVAQPQIKSFIIIVWQRQLLSQTTAMSRQEATQDYKTWFK